MASATTGVAATQATKCFKASSEMATKEWLWREMGWLEGLLTRKKRLKSLGRAPLDEKLVAGRRLKRWLKEVWRSDEELGGETGRDGEACGRIDGRW